MCYESDEAWRLLLASRQVVATDSLLTHQFARAPDWSEHLSLQEAHKAHHRIYRRRLQARSAREVGGAAALQAFM